MASSRKTSPRRASAVLLAGFLVLGLPGLLPPAAASHCGTGMSVASRSPTGAVTGPLGMSVLIEVRFNDTGAQCGGTATMLVDGVPVTATLTAPPGQYVVSAFATLGPGPHEVLVRVEEICCNDAGLVQDFGQANWAFNVCVSDAGLALCTTPGSPVTPTVSVRHVNTLPGPVHNVKGYVDLHTFTLPGPVVVTLPCVVLVVDGVPTNPCAAAGGTYVSTLAVLTDTSQQEPAVSTPASGAVRVCDAVLTATYLGIGVNSAPGLALC